ncbi:MAG: hypothetical protein JXB48_14620 [Candidatus Latescibacteria bacterium]|nr:hypothetical protein [Candidatus Latescibacterota bacterium]
MFFRMFRTGILIFLSLSFFPDILSPQSIYDIRKLTEQDWLSKTTEERLQALNTAHQYTQNQTFIGDFGRYYDLYKRWGYNYYEMNDRYENYAFRGFENYNIIEDRRKRWVYNEFGDRIMNVYTDATIWRETYTGDDNYSVEMPNNYINAVATGEVDGVWVAQEATDDWAVSAIGAGSIRTKFSPLTLSIPNMHGMRIDFQSANTNAALVSSSMLGKLSYETREPFAAALPTPVVDREGVLLRGGYFQRKFGTLTLGASYVNEYSIQANREGGDSWYGTIVDFTPTPLIAAIRFLDDSPVDGEGGPIIYDVRLLVNGEYRYDIIPDIMSDDITRDRTTAITKVTEQDYLTPSGTARIGRADFDLLSVEGSIPKYADYFYLKDIMKGANIKNAVDNYDTELSEQYYKFLDPTALPIHVDGTKTVTYFYDLSTIRNQVNRVQFEVVISNDYRIQTAMIYTRNSEGGHDTAGKNKSYYDATYWRTMAQAEGNVKDNSNVRTLKIDFGLQVASITYGFDMDFQYRGLKISGEYVTNSTHYMYPDGSPGTGLPASSNFGQTPRTGHKWAELDHAYYIIAKKNWKRFEFAGELFKMGKFFRLYLDYYIASTSNVNYTIGDIDARNNTLRIPLIEDNDDDDQYPDIMNVQRTMGYQFYTSEDPDGVFPGLDKDNDSIPDNNKNSDLIPDYNEPFMMFDVDPDEFVFGDDFNNNSIPDFREDDMKMDTPYDLDRKGYHIYGRYTPFRNVNLVAGSFHTGGVGLDNRTNDDYVKLLVNYPLYDIGKLYAEYRFEKIQDDIPDYYVETYASTPARYLCPSCPRAEHLRRRLHHDYLEYKDSKVNRFYVDSVIRAIPSVTMENHVKMERNRQLEGDLYDNTYQPGDVIDTIAMIHKITYTRQFGNWIFSPGFKLRFYKKDVSDIPRLGDYYRLYFPLITCKYFINPRTDIMLGFQGIPGFEMNYKDFIQGENDYKQTNYMIQLQNRNIYYGYNIWSAIGIKIDELRFREELNAISNYKSSTLFINILLGV